MGFYDLNVIPNRYAKDFKILLILVEIISSVKVSFDSKKGTVYEIQYKLIESGKDYGTLLHGAKMGKRTLEAMRLDEDSNKT